MNSFRKAFRTPAEHPSRKLSFLQDLCLPAVPPHFPSMELSRRSSVQAPFHCCLAHLRHTLFPTSFLSPQPAFFLSKSGTSPLRVPFLLSHLTPLTRGADCRLEGIGHGSAEHSCGVCSCPPQPMHMLFC